MYAFTYVVFIFSQTTLHLFLEVLTTNRDRVGEVSHPAAGMKRSCGDEAVL